MSWSDAALAFFGTRAISPEVATAAEVKENGSGLVYPHGRYRPYSGHTLSKQGVRSLPWWVSGRPESAESVLICEGETDGLAAVSALKETPEAPGFRGLPVLSIPGVSSVPPNAIASNLRKYGTSEAFIGYDSDEAGKRASRELADALAKARITPRRAEPPAKDLAAWLANGAGPEDLANLLADAPTIDTGPPSFADVATAEVEWLWRNRIPLRKLTILAGDPKQGKSLLTCRIAAEVARGGSPVLMANADDEPEDVKRRLVALEADFKRIFPLHHFVLPSGINELREAIIDTRAKLLTIDPWDSFCDVANPNRRQEIYRALRPLRDLAAENDCAVLVVCHANRPGENDNPIYRIPVGLRDISRAILSLQRKDDTAKLVHTSTYGEQPPIEYRFDGESLAETSVVEKQAVAEGTVHVIDYTTPQSLGTEPFDA